MDPGHARAAGRAATCHVRLGDFTAALAVLQSAAAATPSADIEAKLQEVAALQTVFIQVGLH